MKVFAAAAISILLMVSLSACGSSNASKGTPTSTPKLTPTATAMPVTSPTSAGGGGVTGSIACGDFAKITTQEKHIQAEMNATTLPSVATLNSELTALDKQIKAAKSSLKGATLQKDDVTLSTTLESAQSQIAQLQNSPVPPTTAQIQQILNGMLGGFQAGLLGMKTLSGCK